MKKLLFLSALIAGSLSFNAAKAQVGIHLNVNLGPRPVYVEPAPVVDDYYYLPDAEAYYSVPENAYYYQDQGRWISSPRLVGRYQGYDYSRMRHYAINESRPYLRNDFYRARYNSPQYMARNNGGFRNQNYGRAYNGGGNYRAQGNQFNNGNFSGGRDGGRHDNGNHNGWNRH